jgi:transposase InsO family protein
MVPISFREGLTRPVGGAEGSPPEGGASPEELLPGAPVAREGRNEAVHNTAAAESSGSVETKPAAGPDAMRTAPQESLRVAHSPECNDPAKNEQEEFFELPATEAAADLGPIPRVRLDGRRPGRRLVKKPAPPAPAVSAEQRLLLLDTWQRSGLPAAEFAGLIGISKHTLYAWKKRFDREGPAGLMEKPRGSVSGSRLPELTKRTILMLKQSHPQWGCQRISDMLWRGPALPASASAVARVLHEAGYELEEVPTRAHAQTVRSFERAKPNQLWQTDLFTFVLKRQNRRVWLVAFLDDHSRFIVSYGLHASQSSVLVLEVLRAGIASYGSPEEILTDNGTQYVTWRGKSAFTKELEKRGIRQIVSKPRHPQTLGKIERFWGTLWRECVETAVFVDFGDARRRIGLFIDHYNFQRCHQGLDGLVPADRFFSAAPEVLRTLKARVAASALELARQGLPRQPFYLTGQVGGKAFSVHAEGERVILTPAAGEAQEIELAGPSAPAAAEVLPEPVCPAGRVGSDALGEEALPGVSALDALPTVGPVSEGGEP